MTVASNRLEWFDHVRHSILPGESLRHNDGLVGCITHDGKYVVTSPNATYIPTPIFGHVDVVFKSNGLFGMLDPILWPQIFCEEHDFYFYPALPMHSSDPVWQPPEAGDLVRFTGSIVTSLYTLSADRVAQVKESVHPVISRAKRYHEEKGRSSQLFWLVRSLQDAMTRLSTPATERDLRSQFACVHRFASLVIGWVRWHTEVWVVPEPWTSNHHIRPDYIGAFTTDGQVAAKFLTAGIPVWYMRPVHTLSAEDVILDRVEFTLPGEDYLRHSNFLYDPIYSGPAGSHHLRAILRGHRYIDIERVPYPQDYERSYPSGSRTLVKPSFAHRPRHPVTHRQAPYDQERHDRCKFDDFKGPFMPPPISIWQDALLDVDRDARRSSESEWGYWLPEPALVIGPQSRNRVLRQVRHWLMIRVPWLYLVREQEHRRDLPVLWWRTYLNSGPSKTGVTHEEVITELNMPVGARESIKKKVQAKARVVEFFGAIFDTENLADQDRVHWFGHLVDASEPRLIQEVAWEISHLAFQIELMELDRHLYAKSIPDSRRMALFDKMFPDSPLLHFQSIPVKNMGLAAEDVRSRSIAVEAFRLLVLDWPNVPLRLVNVTDIDSLAPDDAVLLERLLARFYTQSFFNVAGRAPILPRRLPIV